MKRSILPSFFVAAALLLSAHAHAAPPIASADAYDVPGMHARILRLARSPGDTVTLEIEVENSTDHQIDTPNMGEAKLDDPIQRKEYLVLTAERRPISTGGLYLPAHGRMMLWAKFPAPPSPVTSISVVVPHFVPVDDVPLH